MIDDSDTNVFIGDVALSAKNTANLLKTLGFAATHEHEGGGARVAHHTAMTFSHVVDRARAHFTEMPGLELTLPQAVRLLGFGVDDCRYVIDALVDAGFLKWTARRTIVQSGSLWTPEADRSYVPVRSAGDRNRSVDRR